MLGLNFILLFEKVVLNKVNYSDNLVLCQIVQNYHLAILPQNYEPQIILTWALNMQQI
jgi:hypothetical protein